MDRTKAKIRFVVASKGTVRRDETIKRVLYERAGVCEYWIVDPVDESVRAYRRRDDQFDAPAVWRRDVGDVVTTQVLPGFLLPLDRVFASGPGPR